MKRFAALVFSLLLLPACAQLGPVQPLSSPMNGWGLVGLNGADGAAYAEAQGMVHLRGLVYRFNGPANGEPAFVLPPGYRPMVPEYFTVAAYASSPAGPDFGPPRFGTALVVVYPDGLVTIDWSFGYFAWVSLSGITFRSIP